MKRTCLTYLWMYLGATAVLALAAFVWNPVPAGARDGRMTVLQVRLGLSFGIASTAAFFLTVGIAYLHGTATAGREWRMIRASLAGAPPRDGRWMAAVGVLRADGPLLEAPLSRRGCAVYHYEVGHPAGSDSVGDVLDLWGYGLTPCHVETAAGPVRLLAYADLESPQDVLAPALAVPNLARHLEATAATAIRVEAFSLQGARHFRQVLADDDGRIVTDFRLPGSEPDPQGRHFKERVVEDGEAVCAFGTYAAARAGLVPVPGCPEVFPVRLAKGQPEVVARRLRGKALRGGCAAVPFLVLALAVLVAAWVVRSLFSWAAPSQHGAVAASPCGARGIAAASHPGRHGP